MTGFLTTKRYKCATVYVDQYSRLEYAHLQKSSSGADTAEGKQTFEQYAADKGVTIQGYCADNGIFKENTWVQSCKDKKQTLKFAAVGAHHQNGYAERRIRELQDLARTMLIHANKRWPKSVTTNLWPYALRMANEVLNNTPSMQDKQRRAPLQIFAATKVAINPKHWHPFGCPVYVLNSKLQTNSIFHKWKQKSEVGIYIGTSPVHNKNVALVLSRTTSLVSPQFHVKFDNTFQTVKDIDTESYWQTKAGFCFKTK